MVPVWAPGVHGVETGVAGGSGLGGVERGVSLDHSHSRHGVRYVSVSVFDLVVN